MCFPYYSICLLLFSCPSIFHLLLWVRNHPSFLNSFRTLVVWWKMHRGDAFDYCVMEVMGNEALVVARRRRLSGNAKIYLPGMGPCKSDGLALPSFTPISTASLRAGVGKVVPADDERWGFNDERIRQLGIYRGRRRRWFISENFRPVPSMHGIPLHTNHEK